MKLTEWALRNTRPIVFLCIVLCVAGALIYRSFPVSILPDVTFPRVVVVAESGTRPEKVIEVAVTRPLEEALVSIPNLKRIRSITKVGSTELSIDFQDGTDMVAAEQLVNARVNQVRPELPADTTTETERMNPTVFPILGLTVKSKTLSATELWSLATYQIRPALARVEGVARVVVQGGIQPEVEVEIRPSDLAATGLSISDVVQAIRSNNQVRSVGRFDRQFKQYQIVLNGERQSEADISRIVIGQRGGAPVKLSDIASVHPSGVDRTTVVSANGTESVLVNIVRQPTANSVAMVEAVNAELKNLNRELPRDVQIGLYYDQSVLVKEAIASVRDAVLIGGLLSVLVLVLFLRDLRATVVTASIIPITVLITFLLMRLAGLTLNLMTLGALAVGVGLIIDDAIVVVESVFRNMQPGRTLGEAVSLASGTIAAPMISSTLTTVVVFLPLSFLKGVAGAFFLALALTLTIALMVSLALAICLSPTLCARFLRYHEGHSDESRFVGAIQRAYSSLLRSFLAHRWLSVPIMVATATGAIWIGLHLQTGFMPTLDEGAFVLDYWTPAGTSLEESDRLLRRVDNILESTPEIATFSRRTGTELGLAITEVNRGDYAVMLKTNRKRPIDAVMADVRTRIQAQIPGLDVDFVQVLQDLIGDLAGNPDPIEIKLFGEDKEQIEKVAVSIQDRLSKVEGLVDIKTSAVEGGSQAVMVPNDIEIGRRGLTVDAVGTQLSAALFGEVATEIIEDDREIPVRVRLPRSSRSSLEAIKTLPITTPTGNVLLNTLGDIHLEDGSTQSNREDQRRLVTVSAGLEKIDLGTGVQRVQKILSNLKLPPGVTITLAGQYISQKESFNNLTQVLGASVLLVFTVMLFQFRRIEAPSVVLILMPLGLFGAVLALWVSKTALNVSSLMGVIMLAGIVVKNGILLLDQAQTRWEEGMSAEEAVLVAGQTRLRPILMTTLTAVLGLLPLTLGIGAGAEMQQPLAIAVVGGLLFSTFITLLLGPVLFASIMRDRRSDEDKHPNVGGRLAKERPFS